MLVPGPSARLTSHIEATMSYTTQTNSSTDHDRASSGLGCSGEEFREAPPGRFGVSVDGTRITTDGDDENCAETLYTEVSGVIE